MSHLARSSESDLVCSDCPTTTSNVIETTPVPFATTTTSSQDLTVAPVPLFFGFPEIWTYSHPAENSLSSWSEFCEKLRSERTQRSRPLPPQEILPASEYTDEDGEESIFVGEVNPLILSKLVDLFVSTSWCVSDLDGKALYRLNHLGVDSANSVIDAIMRTDPKIIRSLSKFTMSLCQNYGEMGVIQTSLNINCEGFDVLNRGVQGEGKNSIHRFRQPSSVGTANIGPGYGKRHFGKVTASKRR